MIEVNLEKGMVEKHIHENQGIDNHLGSSKSSSCAIKSVYYIDLFSNIVHNPELTTVLLLVCYYYKWQNPTYSTGYLMDLISIGVNTLFLIRFHWLKAFWPIAELALFVVQNYGCYQLIRSDSAAYAEFSPFFMVCMMLQIAIPYIFMIANFYAYEDRAKFLRDTNNNLLAIFISHSFLYISGGKGVVLLAYVLLQYSLKFFLIYRYTMFQIISVDHDSFETYHEFYGSSYKKRRRYDVEMLFIVCIGGMLWDVMNIMVDY